MRHIYLQINNSLIEKSIEHNNPLSFIFVNYKKDFDSIELESLTEQVLHV